MWSVLPRECMIGIFMVTTSVERARVCAVSKTWCEMLLSLCTGVCYHSYVRAKVKHPRDYLIGVDIDIIKHYVTMFNPVITYSLIFKNARDGHEEVTDYLLTLRNIPMAAYSGACAGDLHDLMEKYSYVINDLRWDKLLATVTSVTKIAPLSAIKYTVEIVHKRSFQLFQDCSWEINDKGRFMDHERMLRISESEYIFQIILGSVLDGLRSLLRMDFEFNYIDILTWIFSNGYVPNDEDILLSGDLPVSFYNCMLKKTVV